MKALTLNDYINDKKYTDNEFAEFFVREQLIDNIADLIINIRKKNGLTQFELAQKINSKPTIISRIETGNSHLIPSLETLIRIAAVFDEELKLV